MATRAGLAAERDLQDGSAPIDHQVRFASAAGLVTAILLAALSLGGLMGSAAYAGETAAWRAQAIAQDWFDLAVASPALAVASLWSRYRPRGSVHARLVQAGLLLYALYVAAIYAFAIHLNALFLVYCAVLGLSTFALFALASLRGEVTRRRYAAHLPARLAGGFLVGVGGVFALLWLAQLAPTTLGDGPPAELVETGLFTNPIHVLDLSFILPLHVIAGFSLWRGRDLGCVLAPALLAFGAMMAASIAFMALTSQGGAGVGAALGAISAASALLLVLVLRALRSGAEQPMAIVEPSAETAMLAPKRSVGS
jgi:hypothetical protein